MKESQQIKVVIRARRRLGWVDSVGGQIPHPRAGSGLAILGEAWGGGLILAQDDVSGFARFDPRTGQAFALHLPEVAGTRRFDPGFGAKRDKPDLESVVAFEDAQGGTVWAFGSGSTPMREKLAIVHSVAPQKGYFVDLPDFYRTLREAIGDTGGEVRALNIEGACIHEASLVLFQRGNGAEGEGPATLHIPLADFKAHIRGGPVPRLEAVHFHDLGKIEGVAWGFTDADIMQDGSGRIAWIGAAEASPDTYADGEVLGSVFGILGGRSARILESDGTPFLGKAEGLAMKPGGAWIVVDPDDPAVPAEVLDVGLEGPW